MARRIGAMKDTRKYPITDARDRTFLVPRGANEDNRRTIIMIGVPFRGPGNESAVAFPPGDIQNGHVGKAAGESETLGTLFDEAVVSKIAENVLQDNPRLALEVECLGNIALAGKVRIFLDKGKNLIPAR